MDHDKLRDLAGRQHDVFSTADAHDAGYDDRAITGAVRRREWVRIRRGFFVLPDVWENAVAAERHLLLARAVARSSREPLALTHLTGALALGVAAWEPDLRTVHVSRLDGRHGVVEYGVTHHQGRFRPEDCQRIDEDLLVAPASYTIFGAMTQQSLDKAVVIGDSAVNRMLLSEDDLACEAEAWERFPFSRSARLATRLVDGRAESPGESLGRFLFWRYGVPQPELQFRIDDPGGETAYLDFMWEEAGVGGEFDGKQKYLRSLRPGEDPGEVVFREKRREDWILEEGTVRTMRRLVWADLFTPTRTAARFRDAIDRGLRRRVLV